MYVSFSQEHVCLLLSCPTPTPLNLSVSDFYLRSLSVTRTHTQLMGSVNTEVDLGIRRSGTLISCKLTRCVLSDSAIALQMALSRSGSASQSQVGSRRNSVTSSPGPEDRYSPSQPLSPAPGMAGIGVILQPAPPDFVEFQVVEVVEGGVAQKSGLIFKDDIISAVDGTITAGRTLQSVTSDLVGAVDTDVTVTIRRSGTELTVRLCSFSECAQCNCLGIQTCHKPTSCNVLHARLLGFAGADMLLPNACTDAHERTSCAR